MGTRKQKIVLILSLLTSLIILSFLSPNLPQLVVTIKSYKTSNAIFDQFQIDYDAQAMCHIPQLLVDDPSLKHLMEYHGPLECSETKNWVYTDDGKFYIDWKAKKKFGKIKCDYYHIERISEDEEELIEHENYKNGSPVIGDGFRVKCRSETEKYRNVHFTVRDLNHTGQLKEPVEKKNKQSLLSDLHVFFYILDSMSRINFIRKLPNFYKFLTNNMSALVMESFNIVGDGTPWSIIPLTTGYYQYELPEARKRFDNSSFLDQWPFIYKDYRKAGYGTVYAEEQPEFNAYTYKLRGFNETPVDHYLRPILQIANSEKRHQIGYCLGDTPKSLMWLSYWKELRRMYEKYDRRTMSILFPGETSHDDYNLVQTLDEHLTNGFKKLRDDNLLNNTLLIVMGDHGRRFGPVRQSQSGKLEEKLPFLAFVPPPWFNSTFPASYSNLMKNKNRLLTVFDLHETLRHILHFTSDGGEGDIKKRGISLFHEIPVHRTCSDASIKPHFCACLDWRPVTSPLTEPVVMDAVNYVVKEMNAWLELANGSCAILSLQNIISANSFKPNDDLMAFKESPDIDNYSADLSANKTLTYVFYQIRFITSPGNADWEVTVTRFLDLNEFKFTEDNLSRLNQYGDQPKCIINTHQSLRSYCYCLDHNKH